MKKKNIAVVYMVAGLSSRFGGKPKWLAKVGPDEESFIEYSIKQALPSGITKIVLIVSEKTKELFHETLGDFYQGTPIHYALQTYNPAERDKPWGTLDALYSAKQFLDCPFIICSGDDLYGASAYKILTDHLKQEDTEQATIGYKLKNVLSKDGGVNRGTFQVNSEGKVISIKEEYSITKENLGSKGLNEETLCSMLFFGLNSKALTLLVNVLAKFKEENKYDRKIEALLPNVLGDLISSDLIKMRAYPTDEQWYGLTNPEDEEIVRKKLARLKHN